MSERVTRGGQQFKAWRKEEGLSRRAAAELFGITYFWVRLIEDFGRTPAEPLRRFIESQTGIPPEAWSEHAEAA